MPPRLQAAHWQGSPCRVMRLTLLGAGAMRSPRYAPAGLLIAADGHRVMLDGGDGASPGGRLDAWLLADPRAELLPSIRSAARERGVEPAMRAFRAGGLTVEPRRVVHTSHATYAYRIRWGGHVVVWAPEFWRFPSFAAGADLMFAEAAGWSRPIRFRGGVGGHMAALDVARAARRARVRRLVFAHIGRPTIRALDRGERPPFGIVARDGQVFTIPYDVR